MIEVVIKTESEEQSTALAKHIGNNLKGGEIIALFGDLGSGKTTFTQGVVEGIGSRDQVTSPTYTIEQIYKSDLFDVHHYDYYRLGESSGIMFAELLETLAEKKNISVIEWPEHVLAELPEERLVSIKFIFISGDENSRKISIKLTENLNYLIANYGDKA